MLGVSGTLGGAVWILVRHFVIDHKRLRTFMFCKDYLVCLNSFKMYRIIFLIRLKTFRSLQRLVIYYDSSYN